MYRDLPLFTIVWTTLLALFLAPPASAQKMDDEEALEIAVEAYIYAYPLVLMDVTRQVTTNCESPDPAKLMAPVNQFIHAPAFPDASFTDVVRPNADTLYSTIWFDVTQEPLVVQIPDSGGRYYLLPMLDMWTDVFACPGKRTTGTAKQTFAIVGPGWAGDLPDGVEELRAPTGFGWVIGRVQANGKTDFDNVHKFQAGLKTFPLSAWGRDYTPPKGQVDPSVSTDPPVEQVASMDASTFFDRFIDLTKDNPPHPNDYPILARMKRIGLEPGRAFDFDKLPPQMQEALNEASSVAQAKIVADAPKTGTKPNATWSMIDPPIGTYGTDYRRRAVVAYTGLGANVVEDAMYPTAWTDADGQPFDSGRNYEMHFSKEQIPPVRAFWSLTMYNDKQGFADNQLDRYAIGDRDDLKFNPDGSLTLYIQRKSPGKEKESNWLPAPKSGGFSMNLRLYWPKGTALDGSWKPPVVKRVK